MSAGERERGGGGGGGGDGRESYYNHNHADRLLSYKFFDESTTHVVYTRVGE